MNVTRFGCTFAAAIAAMILSLQMNTAQAAITAGALYNIVNPGSGLALDVAGCGTGNGNTIQLWAKGVGVCRGGAGQVWRPSLNQDGTYTLINPNSGAALDVAGCGTSNATRVQLWADGIGVCNSGAGQKWAINANSDGTYTLINPYSKNALDVAGCGTYNGTIAQMWANGVGVCNGGAGQKWQFVAVATGSVDLTDARKKDLAMQLVSSAENSMLDWRAQYKYIEDIGDGRGYTGGIIGFTSGTGDMLALVEEYARLAPGNILQRYLPALRSVNGGDSHSGLDPDFTSAWRSAAQDRLFQQAQDNERDSVYFNPSVQQAKQDGLRALGQFIYYDAIVMHGPGNDSVSFGGIRNTARRNARTPAEGGDETTYLNAFLDARVAAMRTEAAHSDTSRVDTAQRVFLRAGNFDLNTPLNWQVYGESFSIK